MTLWDIFSEQLLLCLEEMISLAARHISKFKNGKIASECGLVVKCESQIQQQNHHFPHMKCFSYKLPDENISYYRRCVEGKFNFH